MKIVIAKLTAHIAARTASLKVQVAKEQAGRAGKVAEIARHGLAEMERDVKALQERVVKAKKEIASNDPKRIEAMVQGLQGWNSYRYGFADSYQLEQEIERNEKALRILALTEDTSITIASANRMLGHYVLDGLL